MTDEDLIHAPAEPDLSQSGQQSSVPTAVEIALKAYSDEYALWTYGHYDADPFHAVWRNGVQVAQNYQEAPMKSLMFRLRADASMRAALLALAEADYPPSVIKAGARRLRDGGGRDAANARDVFSAMLRALAKEESQ